MLFKNSKNKNKLFDTTKSTSTFLNLMTKYHNRKNKIKDKDKCYIAKEIDVKRFQLENEEKDETYIYKEAKNISYINQELINDYGAKAKSKVYDTSKYKSPIKLGKKLFFDPTEVNNLQTSSSLKLIRKGVINLPLISKNYNKYNKKPLLTDNNSNTLKNNSNYKNIFQTNSDYSFESKKKYNIISPIKKILDTSDSETNICPSSFRNKNNDINDVLKEEIKNKIIKTGNKKRIKNLYHSNKDLFSHNGTYLTRLTNFKDYLINEVQKQRIFFYRNDYGCKSFKEKYDFLSKKYFSMD